MSKIHFFPKFTFLQNSLFSGSSRRVPGRLQYPVDLRRDAQGRANGGTMGDRQARQKRDQLQDRAQRGNTRTGTKVPKPDACSEGALKAELLKTPKQQRLCSPAGNEVVSRGHPVLRFGH